MNIAYYDGKNYPCVICEWSMLLTRISINRLLKFPFHNFHY